MADERSSASCSTAPTSSSRTSVPGARHATIAPYGPFPTADGTILLAVQNDREWRALCQGLLDAPALATDPRFATNSARAHRDALEDIVAGALAALTTGDADAMLDRLGVACAGIDDISALAAHPVLAGRGRWREVGVPGGTVRALRPPTDLAGIEPLMGAVPALGQHTAAVLGELGRDPTTGRTPPRPSPEHPRHQQHQESPSWES